MRAVTRLLAVALALVLAQWSTTAQSIELYTDDELADALKLYAKNLRGMWQEDLVARLHSDELTAGRQMKLELPLRGRDGHPFEYYADLPNGIVTVPISSVKFLDDISIAYAWYESRGCKVESVVDYVGMLRFRGATAIRLGLTPRVALGVPASALGNENVDDASNKLLKSAVYFLMAHEFAHLYYQHKPYDSIPARDAQFQEVASDAFALDVMRRIRVVPLGIVMFFQTVSRLRSAPGDFATAARYEAAARQEATHPLTTARLMTLGRTIREEAESFAAGQGDPASWRLRFMQTGADIEAMARSLEDPKMRRQSAERNRTITPLALARSCER